MDYTRFEKHIGELRKTVYREPVIEYHEKMIDSAMAAFVSRYPYKDVLDVGFGTGYSLGKFKEHGIKATGITLDDSEFKDAKFIGYDVHLMSMEFLDFEDKSFDLIWCRHALEHSVMPMIALMEFKRVLRDGGYIYIEVPQDGGIHVDNPNHYSMLSDRSWQALMRKTGFILLSRGQFAVHLDGWEDLYWHYWLRKEG